MGDRENHGNRDVVRTIRIRRGKRTVTLRLAIVRKPTRRTAPPAKEN